MFFYLSRQLTVRSNIGKWKYWRLNFKQRSIYVFESLGHVIWLFESDSWGHGLRSIPFVMSGHLIFNFFQTLGLPIFNTNPNNGCPKRIYQHSGQAHKHFSHRFHGVSFLADVQTWRSKQKFVFIATNPPQYQNFCTQCTKIITSVSNDIAR